MADILKLENITKTYTRGGFLSPKTRVEALKGISFSIKEGGSLGLLGQSGCGKTTAAKIILGLEEATSGHVIIEGRDISTLGRKELQRLRGKVQAVFQDPYSSLDPRMTIRQTLEEPFIIHGIKYNDAKLKKLLSVTGLASKFLGRYPHELSGGQRSRVAIARALALEPRLLIADEPVSSLDVSIQAQILNLLKEVKKEYNLSLLFISHDFAVSNFLCDEAAVMYAGKIVESGAVESLFKNPQNPHTKQLLDAVPPLARAVTAKNKPVKERKTKCSLK